MNFPIKNVKKPRPVDAPMHLLDSPFAFYYFILDLTKSKTPKYFSTKIPAARPTINATMISYFLDLIVSINLHLHKNHRHFYFVPSVGFEPTLLCS